MTMDNDSLAASYSAAGRSHTGSTTLTFRSSGTSRLALLHSPPRGAAQRHSVSPHKR